MTEYAAQRLARFAKIIDDLKEKEENILFLHTETGYYIHISVDETVLCAHGARLVSRWESDIKNMDKLCYECIRNVRYKYLSNVHSVYYQPPEYRISWRCTAMVKKRGVKKKLTRCRNTMDGPLDSFCTQHKKCFTKYIHQYISVEPDVLKIIYNKL